MSWVEAWDDQDRVERFWARVLVGDRDECWPWTGTKNKAGYGVVASGKRDVSMKLAHRIAFMLTQGRVPNGHVCHTCDTPPCCNPAHLVDADPKWNSDDKITKGRDRKADPESHRSVKLSWGLVADIERALSEHEPILHIARRFGVDRKTIRNIRDGITWKR